MSDSSLTPFNFEDKTVRIVMSDDNEPLFVAADVCVVLDISNPSNAYARLDDDEKGIRLMDTPGGRQQMVVVTESGLYNLMLKSAKPQAKAFKRWITHEVLPTIRKTGSYSVQNISPLQQLKAMVAFMEQTEARFTELHEKQGALAQDIEAINARLDNREYYTVRGYCEMNGIKYTASLLQLWGKQAAALSRERGIQIRKQEVENRRWATENLYHASILAAVCGKIPPKSGQSELF